MLMTLAIAVIAILAFLLICALRTPDQTEETREQVTGAACGKCLKRGLDLYNFYEDMDGRGYAWHVACGDCCAAFTGQIMPGTLRPYHVAAQL